MKALGKIILLLGMVVFFFMSTKSAFATATLRLSDGTTIIDIADGSGTDISSSANVITFSGSIGNFTVNVTTGVQSGTDSLPVLSFNTFNLTNSNGGTLTAWFSNTDFGTTSSPAGFKMHGSGTAIVGSGSVNFYSYIDNTNTLFGEGFLLGSLGTYSSASYSGDNYGSIASLASPYSLTAKATIDLGGNSIMQTTTNVAIVPEPISSTLFILGGATLGLRRLLKSRKRR